MRCYVNWLWQIHFFYNKTGSNILKQPGFKKALSKLHFSVSLILKDYKDMRVKLREAKKIYNPFTFCRISWLIFVNCCLNITKRGRRPTLLQHSNGITKLICKLEAKENVSESERIYQLQRLWLVRITKISVYNNNLWNKTGAILDKISQLFKMIKCFNHSKKLGLVSM